MGWWLGQLAVVQPEVQPDGFNKWCFEMLTATGLAGHVEERYTAAIKRRKPQDHSKHSSVKECCVRAALEHRKTGGGGVRLQDGQGMNFCFGGACAGF